MAWKGNWISRLFRRTSSAVNLPELQRAGKSDAVAESKSAAVVSQRSRSQLRHPSDGQASTDSREVRSTLKPLGSAEKNAATVLSHGAQNKQKLGLAEAAL